MGLNSQSLFPKTIGTDKIADGAVTAPKLAPGAAPVEVQTILWDMDQYNTTSSTWSKNQPEGGYMPLSKEQMEAGTFRIAYDAWNSNSGIDVGIQVRNERTGEVLFDESHSNTGATRFTRTIADVQNSQQGDELAFYKRSITGNATATQTRRFTMLWFPP